MSMAQSKYISILPFLVSQENKSGITKQAPQQEQLQIVLEELRSVQEELHQKNQLLEIAHQTIKQERKQLRAARQKIREQAAALKEGMSAANYKQRSRTQRLESLGILTSRIVHDLNTILTPILTISQLLRLHHDLSEQSQEMLEMLENSARRGANLTKQILTYSREPHGEHKPTELTSVLQEVLCTTQLTFQKSIHIDCHPSDQPLWLVAADSTQLHQVLMNLCMNAHDAMSDGGVLTVSIENCSINQASTSSVPQAQGENYVLITVTDTGTGISPEVRDRIFEPFFTTKPVGKGTGLGLATVLEIVKDHGGFIKILSEVGQGTSMKVYLPALAESECSD